MPFRNSGTVDQTTTNSGNVSNELWTFSNSSLWADTAIGSGTSAYIYPSVSEQAGGLVEIQVNALSGRKSNYRNTGYIYASKGVGATYYVELNLLDSSGQLVAFANSGRFYITVNSSTATQYYDTNFEIGYTPQGATADLDDNYPYLYCEVLVANETARIYEMGVEASSNGYLTPSTGMKFDGLTVVGGTNFLNGPGMSSDLNATFPAQPAGLVVTWIAGDSF